jgi:anti-anti-sigma factor
MILTEQKINSAIILQLDGRLDLSSLDLFEKKMNSFIEMGYEKIILDCSKLSYISSAGLRILVMEQKKEKVKNGEIILFGINENIKRIFEISGYYRIFPVFNSKDEALRHFEK